ncbi:hypothetical protein D6745_04755 [Candidatus Woesearchaeota archaeon]|nr:MAG: hypothetical protein D6745_04755 [Candidatus Woesearchaeota archaeon]
MKILAMILMVISLSACSAREVTDKVVLWQTKTWTSPQGLVSIDYPADWEAINNYMNDTVDVIFLSPLESDRDPYRDNININIDWNVSDNISFVEEYADASMELNHKVYKDAGTITYSHGSPWEEIELTTLGGEKAVKVNYSYFREIDQRHFKGVIYYTLKADKNGKKYAFVITYASTKKDFDKYLDIATKTIKTFRFNY